MDTTQSQPWTTGQEFAGFRIDRVLGQGGMGTVYLATHPRLPRENALKVLPAHLGGDPVYRARFGREAELAAGLSHPHIVRIHDRGEFEGQFWLSMDYVAGTDAAALLRDRYPGGMPLNEVLEIIAAVASALDYAHQHGLLHRDVKPANILLAEDDGQPRRTYLADFGIARRIDDSAGLTQTDMTVGTVDYSAPEQLRGDPIDGQADQYALACTAFHLLTGKPPYADSNPAVVITKHVNSPPPSIGALRPQLAGLDWVFAVAMSEDPSRRFASCTEFAEQLAWQLGPGFAYAEDIPARAPTNYPQSAYAVTSPGLTRAAPIVKRQKRTGVLVAAVVCVALVLAGGVIAGVQLTARHSPHAAPQPAPPTSAPPSPNTGPFTGMYQVAFSAVVGIDDMPAERHVTPTSERWAVRSVCAAAGCVATASRRDGSTMQVPAMVLDQVDGSWIAVSTGSTTCANAEGEVWETFTLQPLPDGTFAGEVVEAMGKGCANKRTVTFTRIGDVDVDQLPDPAALPPRVSSPAATLHGHYHQTSRQPNGFTEHKDYEARTDCLRTAERCMSLFHTAPAAVLVLLYADETWTYEREFDAKCWKGGMAHVRIVVPFALPQPPQDPIALLAGHGREEITGTACPSTDVEVRFSRTGD